MFPSRQPRLVHAYYKGCSMHVGVYTPSSLAHDEASGKAISTEIADLAPPV
jgi:hypothetical protein